MIYLKSERFTIKKVEHFYDISIVFEPNILGDVPAAGGVREQS